MNNKEVIMAKIKFIKSTAKNGKITTETIYIWSNIDEKDIPVICVNFMEGLLYGIANYSEISMIKPIVMQIDGYKAWSRHYFDGKGFMYSFVDENGKIIDDRENK